MNISRLHLKTYFFVFVLFSFFSLSEVVHAQSHPATDDEFVGPFASWINVKTQFAATGNGTTDETAALQAAFDAIGNNSSTASVVYLPAGTYKITAALTMNTKMNVSVIGEDPSTTKIIWAGAANGTMLQVNGTGYSRFNRITFDGKNIAGTAVDQSWSGVPYGFFDAGNEYADDVFMDVKYGMKGGVLGYGFAETSVMRCKFLRNSIAGIFVGNFNALDLWVWHSVFEDCYVGVGNSVTYQASSASNINGAGNFKVYKSIFRNSVRCDISISNTGEFSFRENTSTNSRSFIRATFSNNPSLMVVQGNTIIDPVIDTAIFIRNQGPAFIVDNVIRSRSGAFSYPVYATGAIDETDLIAIGNTYTVSAGARSVGGRTIISDNPTVSRSSLSALAEPTLPGTQPNLNRQVFEVPVNADATAIQNIINRAAVQNGNRPIVHFPHGTYTITSTLIIPQGTDMQLVGDGDGDVHATMLLWGGAAGGTVLRIDGPSKATIRDLTFHGNAVAANIIASNIDQAGSRVFMHQFESNTNGTGLLVNTLDSALVLAYNSRATGSSVNGINVIGGPLANAGNPQTSRTIVYGGLEWGNNVSNKVTKGGNLLLRDVWYESVETGQVVNLSDKATFAMEGSHATSPAVMPTPQISIANFSGKATFVSTNISNRVAVTGNGTSTKVLGLGNLSDSLKYIADTTSPAATVKSYLARSKDPNGGTSGTGSNTAANIGIIDIDYIKDMLAHVRNVNSQILTPLAAGASDVRLYRVWSMNGLKGLELKGDLVFTAGSLASAIGCINNTLALNTFLTAYHPDNTNTLTWSVISSPSHGSLTGFPAMLLSTSTRVNPSNVGYVPANGYAGTDQFIIQVSDGTATAQITLNITVQNNSWLGVTSADWNTASNWCGGVPTSSSNITIPSNAPNYPEVTTGSVSVNNISFQQNAILKLSCGTLQINGAVTGNGTISGSANSSLVIAGNAGTLNFTSGARTLKNLTLNANASATLGTTLSIAASLAPGSLNLLAGANISTNNNLVFKSDINGTARIAPIPVNGAGTALANITGNVTVERFIPLGKRAFRHLAPGVNSASDIRSNWQNAGIYATGSGIHITGSTTGSNGFDATTSGAASVFTYSPGSANFNAIAGTNSTNKLNALQAYRVFIMGDRNADLTVANNTGTGTVNIAMNSATTLKALGSPVTGRVVYNSAGVTVSGTTDAAIKLGANAADFSFVANPYWSSVDFDKVALNTTDLSPTYWIWDASVGLRGAYVSYTTTGISSGGFITKDIQPGQSIFIQNKTLGFTNNPSITFNEDDKSTGLTNTFRLPNQTPSKLAVRLYESKALQSGGNMQDGAMAVFRDDFKKIVGAEDAAKFTNPDENIALLNNNTFLGVEGRPTVTAADTIPIRIWRLYSTNNYLLKFEGSDFDAGVQPFLDDIYNGNQLLLSTTGSTVYGFSFNPNDSATFYNRFRIVLRAGVALPVSLNNVNAFKKNNGVQIEWTNATEGDMKLYEVERAGDTQSFAFNSSTAAKQNNNLPVSYTAFDPTPLVGNNYYRIKALSISGDVKYSPVVKVIIGKSGEIISVYPNPVKGSSFDVYVNNLAKGDYTIYLYNNAGQKLYEQSYWLQTNPARISVQPTKKPASGLYVLVLKSKEGITYKHNVIFGK